MYCCLSHWLDDGVFPIANSYHTPQDNLFLTSGDPVQTEQVRARLDSGQLIAPGTDVHAVAETMVRYMLTGLVDEQVVLCCEGHE